MKVTFQTCALNKLCWVGVDGGTSDLIKHALMGSEEFHIISIDRDCSMLFMKVILLLYYCSKSSHSPNFS